MNLFQLVFKQMRQRALGTWLTLLSVLLGVALATAVFIFQREGERLFTQADFGYDIIVGPSKGSPLQLTLNTVYNMDTSPGLVSYDVYKELLANRRHVRLAVPIAKGDTFEGLPIIGTLPRMFNFTNDESEKGPQPIPADFSKFEYQVNKSYELAQGTVFHPLKFEAVVGSEVPVLTKVDIGGKFKATHGNPPPGAIPDIHDQEWTVVGRLKPTGTAADRAIYIPLISFFAISEHEDALEAIADLEKTQNAGKPPAATPSPATKPDDDDHDHDHDHGPATNPTDAHKPDTHKDDHGHGHDHDHEHQFHMDGDYIHLEIPESEWKLSAILVRSRGGPSAMQVMWQYRNSASAAASNPAQVMTDFFRFFFKPSTNVLVAIAALVSVVAAAGILVAIYNSVSARMKEIAILRALGATRERILMIICTEAGLVGMLGGLGGILTGHLIVLLAQGFLPANFGSINALRFTPAEGLYFLAVVALSVLAGLVPALKAYRVPVATNLTT